MAKEQSTKLFFLGIFPRCPFYCSALHIFLMMILIALATVGIYFLNIWLAVACLIYSVFWYFLFMPIIHCRYCYYEVKDNITDPKNKQAMVKLTSLDKWRKSYLSKHVACGKKYGFNFFISWFLPIILIGISLFLEFSTLALISLIGFIVVMALMLIHMRWIVCPKCAIVKECHAAF